MYFTVYYYIIILESNVSIVKIIFDDLYFHKTRLFILVNLIVKILFILIKIHLSHAATTC